MCNGKWRSSAAHHLKRRNPECCLVRILLLKWQYPLGTPYQQCTCSGNQNCNMTQCKYRLALSAASTVRSYHESRTGGNTRAGHCHARESASSAARPPSDIIHLLVSGIIARPSSKQPFTTVRRAGRSSRNGLTPPCERALPPPCRGAGPVRASGRNNHVPIALVLCGSPH
jgi:hypothetical protein